MLRRAAAQAAASLSRRACVQGAPCSVISSLSSTGSAQLAATACRRELGAASVSTFRGFCAGPSRPENEGPPGSTPSDAGRPSTSAKSETAVPVTKVLETPPFFGFRDVYFALERLSGDLWVRLIKAGVDPTFEEEGFLEGATDAFEAVMEKFAERDIAGLEPLTCKAVRDAFEGTWEQYDKQNVSMKFEVQAVSQATILGGGMVSDETLGETDLTLTPEYYVMHGYKISSAKYRKLHLMVKVRFHSVESVELTDKATGAVTANMEDRRGHVWYLAREVPAVLPAESGLDSPWRLVRLE